ncbi:MAG: hypothetical protein ACHQQS_04025 [Thermoanaerobaculales bacterium]
MLRTCEVTVLVDGDVNVHDPAEVAWRALGNIDPQRDMEFVSGEDKPLDRSSRMP